MRGTENFIKPHMPGETWNSGASRIFCAGRGLNSGTGGIFSVNIGPISPNVQSITMTAPTALNCYTASGYVTVPAGSTATIHQFNTDGNLYFSFPVSGGTVANMLVLELNAAQITFA